MTPEERIRYRLQGIVNQLHRRFDDVERRLRLTRPSTPEEIAREERRRREPGR